MTRRIAILLCAGFLLAPISAPSGVAFASSGADLEAALEAALEACKQLASDRQKDKCVKNAKERHGAKRGGQTDKNGKRDK